MPMPPSITTQTSSLVSTVVGTSASIEPRAEFDEYIVISLGDYYYRKSDKAMVKNGKKRTREQISMDVSVTDQIVWTQQFSDPQVHAADTAVALGAFTGSNLHVVNTLNMEFDRRKEDIKKLKEQLENTRKEHEAHVADLMKMFEDNYNELHIKSASLQVDL